MKIKLTSFIFYVFISFLFYLQSTNAQIPIHAVVSDAVSDIPLENVQVHSQNSELLSKSDNNGYFYLTLNSNKDSSNLKGYFLIENNILHSFFNTSFDLFIYDSLGKIHYQKNNVSERNSISLNHLSSGYYFIKIYSSTGNYTYKLIISPIKNYISTSTNHSKNYVQKSDTIVFSKNNYFDRKVALSNINFYNSKGIKLLKNEYQDIDYFNELISKQAFETIANQPSKTHLNDVESVKIIFDSKQDKVYYINSKKHTLHYSFAKDILKYPYTQNTFNSEQYTNNPKRYLFPATLNYFKELDVYTFEFFSSYGAVCDDVYLLYNKISESSFLKDKLHFYATNDSWITCDDIPIITSNELYEGQNYQALNIAEGYGYLKKIDIDDLKITELQKHDIILINGIPIDIPVIAGIITTEFQTPLSHINVLSHNRGTPNMALKNGFENVDFNTFDEKLIYLKVATDTYQIRDANLEEATDFWNKNEPKDTIVLNKDVSDYGLFDLKNATINDVDKIGGKAANFAEILKAFDKENTIAPVPENYFAIPFYYYQQHLENYGIDTYIKTVLSQSEFKENAAFRKTMLEKIQDSIKDSPLDQNLLEKVLTQINSDDRFTSYRFRSSTNAEDLDGFNGAGLYNSYSGKLNNPDKTVDKAIKKVWASLWNYNAFEERDYFKIDHFSTSMGILVHRSFPNEDANGVVITKNIFNRTPAYVVNVQFKEISVVDAEPGIIHDQVIIYTFSLNDEKYTLEYNTSSNILKGSLERVMSNEELFKLGDYLSIINTYFYTRVYNCKCDYRDFGLDIEFKVDSSLEERKIYIKQARPY